MRVVVLGGYGNFGRIVAERLASDPSFEVVVAGRDAPGPSRDRTIASRGPRSTPACITRISPTLASSSAASARWMPRRGAASASSYPARARCPRSPPPWSTASRPASPRSTRSTSASRPRERRPDARPSRASSATAAARCPDGGRGAGRRLADGRTCASGISGSPGCAAGCAIATYRTSASFPGAIRACARCASAPVLWRAGSALSRFGSGRSAMFVRVSGRDGAGRARMCEWELFARRDHGRHVPCLAAVALARKLAGGAIAARGAMPCVGLVTLDEYLAEAGELEVATQRFDAPAEAPGQGPKRGPFLL